MRGQRASPGAPAMPRPATADQRRPAAPSGVVDHQATPNQGQRWAPARTGNGQPGFAEHHRREHRRRTSRYSAEILPRRLSLAQALVGDGHPNARPGLDADRRRGIDAAANASSRPSVDGRSSACDEQGQEPGSDDLDAPCEVGYRGVDGAADRTGWRRRWRRRQRRPSSRSMSSAGTCRCPAPRPARRRWPRRATSHRRDRRHRAAGAAGRPIPEDTVPWPAIRDDVLKPIDDAPSSRSPRPGGWGRRRKLIFGTISGGISAPRSLGDALLAAAPRRQLVTARPVRMLTPVWPAPGRRCLAQTPPPAAAIPGRETGRRIEPGLAQ